MKVIAIIVTYNGLRWIDKCLGSLSDARPGLEIIVIDNGSKDGTCDKIRSDYPKVELIESRENLGFSKANNLGLEMAVSRNADYVFLLNQDAWIEENVLIELIRIALENPVFGIVSPIHLNGAKTALDLNFASYLQPNSCPEFYSDLYIGKLKELYKIDFVNAAAWLISKSCLRAVGFFEPLFFFYGEDSNYLQRVVFKGFKVGITPNCQIFHDREIRNGALNDTGVRRRQRRDTLMILLDIRYPFRICVVRFLKRRVFGILSMFYRGQISSIRYDLAEICYFLFSFAKLVDIRRGYKSYSATLKDAV